MKYTLIDFLQDMAFHLDKASNFTFNDGEAREHACEIYQDLMKEEGNPRFGDPEYDWTHEGAYTLVYEYSISYWDDIE